MTLFINSGNEAAAFFSKNMFAQMCQKEYIAQMPQKAKLPKIAKTYLQKTIRLTPSGAIFLPHREVLCNKLVDDYEHKAELCKENLLQVEFADEDSTLIQKESYYYEHYIKKTAHASDEKLAVLDRDFKVEINT